MLHRKSAMGRKTFVIWSAGVKYDNGAFILDVADTQEEAFHVVRVIHPGAVIYEYENDGTGKLINGKRLN